MRHTKKQKSFNLHDLVKFKSNSDEFLGKAFAFMGTENGKCVIKWIYANPPEKEEYLLMKVDFSELEITNG